MSKNELDFDPFNSESKTHLCIGGVTGSDNFMQAVKAAMDMLQAKIHDLQQKSDSGTITDSELRYLKELQLEQHQLSDELKNCEQ